MILSLIFLISFVFAREAPILFESGTQQVSLIELYSSEGCSSCPPADRWMAELKNHPKLWKDFVPLNFHVDYWNRLGWVDRFSNEQFTLRQRRYARQWGSSRVYTPAFVKDGKEWRTRSLVNLGNENPGNLKVKNLGNNKVKVIFVPRGKTKEPLVVNMALLGNGLSTKVKYGENSGETLKHEFVVLNWQSSKLEKKGSQFETLLKVPESKTKGVRSFSLAFWINKKGIPTPIQSVGGPFNENGET